MRINVGVYVKKAEVLERTKYAGYPQKPFVSMDFDNIEQVVELLSECHRVIEDVVKVYQDEYKKNIVTEIEKVWS